MNEKRARVSALIGVVLLLVGIGIVITVPAADGYEISIYAAYPLPFWIAIVGAQFAGCLAIVGSVGTSEDRSWVFGLPILILSNLLLLLLPYVRGYEMFGRTDAMSHVGFVLDIVQTGTIVDNIYPPTHLLSLVVVDATGIEVTTAVLVLPVVFWGVYFVSMSVLLFSLFEGRNRILFGLPFVVLPVHASLGLRPYDVGVALVPLVFYLFVKSQRHPTPAVRTAFVVTLIGYILYHPLTAIFVIGVFAVYLLGRKVPYIKNSYASPTNFFSLSTAVLVAWYSNFVLLIVRFDKVYNRVFGLSEGSPPIGRYTETVNETSPALIDIVRVITFKYGIELALFGLGFAFVGLALWYFLRRKYTPDTYVLMLVGMLTVFSFGGLGFLLADLVVSQDRPWKFAKIAGVLLAGQLFYLAWRHVDWRNVPGVVRSGFSLSLVAVLLVVVALATFSLFPSPLGSSNNPQVTEMEMEGTQWLAAHGDRSHGLMQFDILFYRFYDAQYGRNASKPYYGDAPPPRFNYTEYESFGQSVSGDEYLTITRLGREFYPTVHTDYRENWRYAPRDFERLGRDTTVDRVYDNGDYEQYLVQEQANATT